MERARENEAKSIDRRSSREWEELIRKLRWIGLDDEARRLNSP